MSDEIEKPPNDITLSDLIDGNGMVIDYVALIKYMRDDGTVAVRSVTSDSLNTFEAIGLLTTHADDLRYLVSEYRNEHHRDDD